MGAFGGPAKKALVFIGNLARLPSLSRGSDAEDRERFQIEKEGGEHELCCSEFGADGRTRCHGGKDLTPSAAYPQGFESAVALLFDAGYKSRQ
eukprot:2386673-Pyramimonas_sp.AAC.1